jgi:hypothetical protein
MYVYILYIYNVSRLRVKILLLLLFVGPADVRTFLCSTSVETDPGALPAPCTMGTLSLSQYLKALLHDIDLPLPASHTSVFAAIGKLRRDLSCTFICRV